MTIAPWFLLDAVFTCLITKCKQVKLMNRLHQEFKSPNGEVEPPQTFFGSHPSLFVGRLQRLVRLKTQACHS
ncbi:MAG: hypothetical protein KME06_10560 [Kastovskya adunca ATA6-11-RM4]|jgi:hypothetical protein|nr:hypothetical protein [Kastovskya adunca ATA6-11-RM4]